MADIVDNKLTETLLSFYSSQNEKVHFPFVFNRGKYARIMMRCERLPQDADLFLGNRQVLIPAMNDGYFHPPRDYDNLYKYDFAWLVDELYYKYGDDYEISRQVVIASLVPFLTAEQRKEILTW